MLSSITLQDITTAGVAVIIHLCASCRDNHVEMERIIHDHLEPAKELYALTLQTGEVTLPLGSKYPHVTYPAPGSAETSINNIWIVDGDYMGKAYECHKCGSYMRCYQDAGLITYNIVRRDSTLVRSAVCPVEKGKQHLIERHISGFHPIISARRQREQLEAALTAKEKFDLEIYSLDTAEIYHCKVHRKLEIIPFIEALGATGKENQSDHVHKLHADLNSKRYPMVTYIEMEP